MAKVSHHTKLTLAATILLLMSFVSMEQALAQQDGARGSSGEPKKPETEATLFPVPDFTSDIWTRAKLTGDWFGLRTKMANNGVQLDMDNVHTF